jgi:cytochrome c2
MLVEKPTKMNQFRAWALVATAVAVSTAGFAAAKGDPEKGKAVFEQCGICHNSDSEEKKNGLAPGLKGLFKRDRMGNNKKPTEANVRAQIDDGGNGMPAYKDLLTDGEKDDLIAYLKTL